MVSALEEPTPVAAALSGPEVYNPACLACHATGVGGAPLVGDAGAWAPRIAKGMDVLSTTPSTALRAKPVSCSPKAADSTCPTKRSRPRSTTWSTNLNKPDDPGNVTTAPPQHAGALLFCLCQVGDRSRDSEDALVAARRQIEPLGRTFQQLPARLANRADAMSSLPSSRALQTPERHCWMSRVAAPARQHPRCIPPRHIAAQQFRRRAQTSTCRSMRSSSGPDILPR